MSRSLAMAVWFVISACRVSVAEFATPQLLLNPGFESGEGARAADWGLWPPAGRDNGVSSQRDSAVKHSGECSGRLRIEVEDYKGVCTWHHRIVPCLRGQEFVLSFWVKAENVVGACGVDVQLRVDETRNTDSAGTKCERGTYDWKHQMHRFSIPPGFKFICVVPYLQGKGTLWFDEVELYGAPELHPLAADSPPKLDGDLSDSCWTAENRVSGFTLTGGLTIPARQTEAWAAFDAASLYFAFRCERKPEDKLKTNVRKRDGDVWTDDDVEVFLNPRGDFGEYYQFIVNPAGAQYDSRGTDRNWTCKWAAKTRVTLASWNVEIALPIAELPVDLSVGPNWCANFGRSDRSTGQASSWSATFDGFHSPGRFGRLLGVGCDFVPAYVAEGKTRLEALRDKLEEASRGLAFESAPATLVRDSAELLAKLRAELASFENQLKSPLNASHEQWAALPARFQRFQTDLAQFTSRSLRLKVFSFWKERIGQAPPWGVALASPLHKVARDGEGFAGEVGDRIHLAAARGEYESAQLAVLSLGEPVHNCRVEVGDLSGPHGHKLSASQLSVHPVGYVKTAKPSYPTERVGWWPDPFLPPGPMNVAASEVQPFWLTAFAPYDALSGLYGGPVRITDGQQTLTCRLELRVRNFALPRKGNLATPFGCSPADISLWYSGSRDYRQYLEVDDWLRWCRFMLDYRLSPTAAGQAYLRRKYRDDGTFEWDYSTLDRVMTELAPRTPDESIAMAGTGTFGWRGDQGGVLDYVPPGHAGQRAGRVRFPKTESWSSVSRPFPGKLASDKGVTHLSFWLKTDGPTDVGEQVVVFLNSFPLRYLTTVKLPGGDWQFVRIPISQFQGNRGEGPLDNRRLAVMDNLQFVIGNKPKPITFLIDDVVAEHAGGQFTVDDFELEAETREIAQSIGSHVRHWKGKRWLKLGHVYGWDEARPEEYETVRLMYRKTLAAVPEARIMQTYYVNPQPKEFIDLVKVWCPITSVYNESYCQQRLRKGESVWLYVCCGPHPPFANFFIDQPALTHRILFWQAWQRGATGFLYWETNYWQGNFPEHANAPRWPAVPWSAEKAGTYVDYKVNGDGWLIYPGPNLQPLPSVRLENIRDGIEDYEYLYLLRDLVGRARRAGSARPKALRTAEALLRVGEEISKDFTHYTGNGDMLLRRREQIGEAIERLSGQERD